MADTTPHRRRTQARCMCICIASPYTGTTTPELSAPDRGNTTVCYHLQVTTFGGAKGRICSSMSLLHPGHPNWLRGLLSPSETVTAS